MPLEICYFYESVLKISCKSIYFNTKLFLFSTGDIAIALTDSQGKDVPVNTIDNQDGTFKIEYTPSSPGTYTVSVFFANSEIPKSPIKVNVESSIDLSKVKVVGLDTRKFYFFLLRSYILLCFRFKTIVSKLIEFLI